MSLYDVEVRTITGEAKTLRDFADKTLLVVNVASKCGFTPQYKGLEELHQRYKDHGLVVLGFPCDQFGHQEPGDEAEIQRFCSLTYDVSFPMFAKVEVNGAGAHPLFVQLKKAAPGLLGTQAIKWNFTKFLVRPDGRTITRFSPRDEPASLAGEIERALPRGA
jgi:glutathione peroxidase